MVEPDSGGVRTVVWAEVCPWLSILRCFRIAISLRVLVFGAVGIFLTLVGNWILGNTFHAATDLADWQPTRFGESYFAELDAAFPSRPPFLQPVGFKPSALERLGEPFVYTWSELSDPGWRLLNTPRPGVVYGTSLALYCLWTLAVWAFFGGAICRIAVVQLAADERVGWAAALRFARRKWLSYFAAPLFPLLGVLVAAVPLAILGLLMRGNGRRHCWSE